MGVSSSTPFRTEVSYIINTDQLSLKIDLSSIDQAAQPFQETGQNSSSSSLSSQEQVNGMPRRLSSIGDDCTCL